jgi:3-dehydroquinate synthase
MLKHGLIQDPAYWEELKNMSELTADDLGRLIAHSVTIKSNVVAKDPREGGWRKILNFGHTLGHAIESYFLKSTSRESLLHGEAIAIGMIMEAYLSHEVCQLPLEKAQEIKDTFLHFFGKIEISDSEMQEILPILKFDKKNASGAVNFVLLEDIGKPIPDKKANNELIIKSLEFYNN